jgi:peroxiredoxin
MLFSQSKDDSQRPWRIAVALGCTLLLLFCATIQVAHVHTPADVSHSGCALCASAHVVIAAAAPLTVSVALPQRATLLVDRQIKIAHRYVDFSLYTRPPPVAVAFS